MKAYDVKRGKDKENKKNSKDFVKLKAILLAILFTSLALTAGTVADIYGITDLGNTRRFNRLEYRWYYIWPRMLHNGR